VSSNDNLSSESKERDRLESLPHESQKPPLRLGVLISGSGSNLQALIDAIESKQLPGVEIALVVSNKADAHGLQRALKHKLPAIYLPWSNVGAGLAPALSVPAMYTPTVNTLIWLCFLFPVPILTHLGDKLPFAVQIIDQQVFTKVVLIGVEGATMVDRRELIHKGHHPTIILQHEGINGDALARASLHL
jgi:formyl transferase-like protein